MFIDVVPNGRSASAVLLRESYREGSKVRKRTLANLSKLPPPVVDGLRVLLQGGTAIARTEEIFEIQRSLPHGHVAAVIGMMRKLDLPRLLGRTVSRERDLALALIASRIIAPGSKLATARALSPETASSSLGRVLDLGIIEEREIYAALDWLGEQQDRIERSLARRHLKNGALVLYDISSSYVEGRCCELARHGYSRDRRPDRLQIVYGLLCDRDGRPIAVEVFEGDVGDPSTLSAQISKLKQRFGLKHVILVGDRGMITSARIRQDLQPAGLDWITTLRAPQIQALTESGPLQLSLFDERNLAEITAPDYPGERLIVCRNPELARERARKRDDLLAATERDLSRIVAHVGRRHAPLRGKAEIGLAVGAVIDRHKMGKHYELTITDDS
ncbi:MAG: IS1634 family transposase, partial [Acetobacteraceae bacterium]|nr:IS1634 family transposase [Acetobacteraceae bacterium]